MSVEKSKKLNEILKEKIRDDKSEDVAMIALFLLGYGIGKFIDEIMTDDDGDC